MDYSQPFLCRRRLENGADPKIHPFVPKEDHWREGKDGTHTCSYCGSMSESDFIEIVQKYVDDEPGYSFDPSTKHYKYYAHKPGVRNADMGAIKFYTMHIESSGDDLSQNQQLVIRAATKFNQEMDALVNRKPENGEAKREDSRISDS